MPSYSLDVFPVVAVESRTVIRATSADPVAIAIVNALVIADLIAVVVIAKGAAVLSVRLRCPTEY